MSIQLTKDEKSELRLLTSRPGYDILWRLIEDAKMEAKERVLSCKVNSLESAFEASRRQGYLQVLESLRGYINAMMEAE